MLLETVKTPGLSSWRKIGHYVLTIMNVKKPCHCLVCSAFHKSLLNDTDITVKYRYTIVPMFNMLNFTLTSHQCIIYMENAVVSILKVGTYIFLIISNGVS